MVFFYATLGVCRGHSQGRRAFISLFHLRPADAQKKLQAGIDEANHGATKLNLTVKGKLLVSGQNVEVSLGALSGKYFTDTTTHNLGSSGYTTDLELSLIE